MRRYELALVGDPTIPEEQYDKLITAFEELIADRSGRVQKVDRWGRRKLAYRIRSHSEGNYTFILFDGEPALVAELTRRIRLSENWLRHSSVRADHETPPTEEELEALQEARQEQIRRAKEREERERLAREEAEAAAARGEEGESSDEGGESAGPDPSEGEATEAAGADDSEPAGEAPAETSAATSSDEAGEAEETQTTASKATTGDGADDDAEDKS